MRRIISIVAITLLLVACGLAAAVYLAGSGYLGTPEGAGQITAKARPASVRNAATAAQRRAAAALGESADKQILFGDLHVHSTFSVDAFFISLPTVQGEGAHPVADACDFARYCSGLDFFSINDHAESLTPTRWRQTVDSIRQCNAVAGDATNPDLVAFLGWEWTQVGQVPADHYGHKNVVLESLDEDAIPTRPIAARGVASMAMRAPSPWGLGMLTWLGGGGRLFDLARHLQDRGDVPECAEGVDARALPADCLESAATPEELFRKLDEWGVESIVIPHGTTWGFYTPPGSSWDKQLTRAQHDPKRQTLIEVYSGHGNSEVYRDWRGVRFDTAGKASCPPPTRNYLPTCWRAGEIVGERCRAAGLSDDECAKRSVEARQIAADAGTLAHLTVPGVRMEEWLDAGQCRDCVMPSFNYRPASSVQYIMALRNFDDPQHPQRFDFGFMASSDIHKARPGTGYKEYHRREMTEATGARNQRTRDFLAPKPREPVAQAEPVDRQALLAGALPFAIVETERQASFFLTGGLIATHASGRDRRSIWEAMQRREVYGTSGPRILLWFDLLNGAPAAARWAAPPRSPRRRVFASAPPVPSPRTPAARSRRAGRCRRSAWSTCVRANATTRRRRAG